MGIKQLAKLIADVAPDAIKEQEIASYFGRRIAIDASTSLYQFLVAIRMRSDLMVNGSGEATSHLIGFFYRTNKLLEVSFCCMVFIDRLSSIISTSLILYFNFSIGWYQAHICF